MKNILLITLVVCALLCGCSHFSSTVTEMGTNGVKKVTTVHATTFFDSKSELAKVSSGQTDKSQRVAIGALNQEASGTNAVAVLNALAGVVGALPK